MVLCTGAYTAELLANSAPHRPELQVGGRLVAAGAAMCLFRPAADDLVGFDDVPVFVNPMSQVESIPLGSKGLMKCTHEASFTNYIFFTYTGYSIVLLYIYI